MTQTGSLAEHRSQVVSPASFERAMVEGELALYHQPIVDLVDGALTGFEALVRWQHPELGLLAASSFITVLEGHDHLMRALDDWVLDTACRQLAAWQEDVLVTPGFRLAVNMSAGELDGSRLMERVTGAVRRSGVDAHGLVIEVTESMGIDSLEAATRNASSLHDMGIALAIDDFGMQHSWLSRLQSLPFDVLKIDRAFVQDASTDSGAAFMRAVVALGSALHLRIVAEGIETAEQARTARALGCHEGQGFFWAPGIAPAAATRLLVGAAPSSPAGMPAPWFPNLEFA
jgi:EAL domain-containing protein (putative c-di-GMP-specific phosphodiesterase class I)